MLCESTNDCVGSLMSQLEEIHRDIRHANKTIDTEKLSTSMRDKLYELEDAYKDHFIGFKNSHGSYVRSIDSLTSRFKLNKLNLTAVNVVDSVDKLESLTKSVEDSYMRQYIPTNEFETDYFHILMRQEALLERHILQISHIDDIESTLNNIGREQDVNRTSLLDAIEKQLIIESKSKIVDQVSDGALLKGIYDNVLEKFMRINENLSECRNYRHPQAVKLIENRLFGSGNEINSTSFSDSLHQITEAALECSHKSRATLKELFDISRSFNNSLESSEHLISTGLGKDLQALKKDLDELSSRLKNADTEMYRLQNVLNSITMLKTSTQELSKTNSGTDQWIIDHLIPKEQELNSVRDLYMNQTYRLIEWTNLLSLPESINQIEANLNEVDLNIDQLLVELDA